MYVRNFTSILRTYLWRWVVDGIWTERNFDKIHESKGRKPSTSSLFLSRSLLSKDVGVGKVKPTFPPLPSWSQIFKLSRTPGIDSTESIPYYLTSLYSHGASNTQAVSSKCNLYQSFFEGIAQFTVWARVNICYRFHTWFLLNSRNRSSPPPFIPSKNLTSDPWILHLKTT